MSDRFLSWIQGRGWLVFSGGYSSGSPIRAQALERAKPAGGVAYISLADDGGDSLLDDMEDLGAPAGYIVDIRYEDAASLMEQLQDVAVLALQCGDSLDALYQAFQNSIAAQAIQKAYENGAVVLLEGLTVNLFGKWVISDTGQILAGLDWLTNVFIEPGVSRAEESRAVQKILQTEPEAIAIEINTGSALVCGASGQLELWGGRDVTISLGTSYSDDVS